MKLLGKKRWKIFGTLNIKDILENKTYELLKNN